MTPTERLDAIAAAGPEELPGLVMAVAARLIASMPGMGVSPAPASEDRALTLVEVAAFLGVSNSYAYELARQARIPTVRLPGVEKTNRGGTKRRGDGKYVRVRLSSLLAWMAEHEVKMVDSAFNAVLKSDCDWPGSAANPKGARALTNRVRRGRRRHLRNGEPMGDGREPSTGTDREVDSAPGSQASAER